MPTNVIGVVGTDGYTPISQPDARWTTWSVHEIYMGAAGLNKFVPKVNDYVIEPESSSMYRVASVSDVTLIPELVAVNFNKTTVIDHLYSDVSYSNRFYFDKSISPYTLSTGGFGPVYHPTASFARIYRGVFIDPAKIISKRYNNSGVFVGHDIQLDLVAYNSHDNYGVKSVQTCNTTDELLSGETCTLVIFDTNGKVLDRRVGIVEETTFVAQAYAEQKYITNIFLKSAFIADTNSSEINYPVNLPITSFNPIGVVQFNDGSQVEYPVDNDKFSLIGLDSYVSTIIGHNVNLVLSYRMSAQESGLASTSVNGHFITRPYRLVVSSPNTSYNVKLFAYPVWVDELTGYSLKFFMMNLDRNIIHDVTALVGLTVSSPAFSPKAYGSTQRLTYMVDLAQVSGVFNHFLHVQTMDIVLRGPASDDSITNIWEVASEVPSLGGYYGTSLKAVVTNPPRTKVNIANNFATQQAFIDAVFTKTHPLHNPVFETQAPAPTHMEVRYNAEAIIVPITQYAADVTFIQAVTDLSNISIVFLRQTTSGFLKLSVASMTVR